MLALPSAMFLSKSVTCRLFRIAQMRRPSFNATTGDALRGSSIATQPTIVGMAVTREAARVTTPTPLRMKPTSLKYSTETRTYLCGGPTVSLICWPMARPPSLTTPVLISHFTSFMLVASPQPNPSPPTVPSRDGLSLNNL